MQYLITALHFVATPPIWVRVIQVLALFLFGYTILTCST
jgi:hypothetical protein